MDVQTTPDDVRKKLLKTNAKYKEDMNRYHSAKVINE